MDLLQVLEKLVARFVPRRRIDLAGVRGRETLLDLLGPGPFDVAPLFDALLQRLGETFALAGFQLERGRTQRDGRITYGGAADVEAAARRLAY